MFERFLKANLKLQTSQGRGPWSAVENQRICLLLRECSTYLSKNIALNFAIG